MGKERGRKKGERRRGIGRGREERGKEEGERVEWLRKWLAERWRRMEVKREDTREIIRFIGRRDG